MTKYNTPRILLAILLIVSGNYISIGQIADSIKIDSLIAQATRADSTREQFAKEAYQLASKEADTKRMIAALQVLDQHYFSTRDNKGTIATLQKLAKLYDKRDEPREYIRMQVYLCMAYRNLKKYDSLIISYNNGMEVAEKHNFEVAKAGLYIEMGDYYKFGVDEPNKAVEYLKRAMPIYRDGGSKYQMGLSRIYHDLAKSYHQLKEPDSTKKYVTLGLALADTIGKASVIEIMNAMQADFLLDNGNYAEAIPYAKRSLQMAKELNNLEAIAFSSANLAKARIATEQYDSQTLTYINEAIAAADSMGVASHQQVEAYGLSSKYHTIMQDYKQALSAYQQATLIRDSLRQKTIDQDLQRLTHEHELLEKQSEVNLLEAKNQARQRINYLLAGLISLLLLIGVILYNRMRLKQKLNKQKLQQLEIEKANEAARLDLIRAEQKIKEERNKALTERVQSYERELASTMLFIAKKNEALTAIQDVVDKNINKPEHATDTVVSINNLIKRTTDRSDDWEAFKLRFEKVHPQFFSELTARYPSLNSNDKRLLCFVKMGMDNGEIARITGINVSSIYKSRYRIRKKLNITEEVGLNELINAIG